MNNYNIVKDKIDTRDKLYVANPMDLPNKCDLTPLLGPPFDQGQLGSCSANAFAGALEYLHRNKLDHTDFIASRLFLYWSERKLENTIQSDSGAQLRDGIKSLVNTGVCREQTWPYNITLFEQAPPPVAYTEAANFKVHTYTRLNGLPDMKHALANGFPVIFGMMVYESFESESVAQTGILNLPTPNEQCLGGHAVLSCGYDDSIQRITVRNSWGSNFGMNGNFTMPYAYVENPNLVLYMWIIEN